MFYILICQACLTRRIRNGRECEALSERIWRLDGCLYDYGPHLDLAAERTRALLAAIRVRGVASDSVSFCHVGGDPFLPRARRTAASDSIRRNGFQLSWNVPDLAYVGISPERRIASCRRDLGDATA